MKALPFSEKYRILPPGLEVCLETADKTNHFHTVKSSRDCGRYFLVSFHDIADLQAAMKYRGALITVDRETLALDEGEFFYDQIVGLSVFTVEGAFIGKVEDIFPAGSNDVYVVRGEGREYLIPAIRHFIAKVDIPGNRVIVTDIESLLD